MGAITIRQLDDDVIARLKDKAKLNGRSMEEEARTVLTRAVGRRMSGEDAIARFRNLREHSSGDRPVLDTTQILREIRDEDPAASLPDPDLP
jgi:plasmid stability protein